MTLRLRSFGFALLLLSSSFTAACSWTSDGGLGARIESDVRSKSTDPDSWVDAPVRIYNVHGQIEIVGVPGKRNVSVHARMVAGARSQADADAAFADLFENVRIEKVDDAWAVECGNASEWHGSVDPESTGCTLLRVEIPAGSVDAPLDIRARADFGGVHATGLVVSKLHASAPFGLLADVTPVRGAEIEMRGDALVSGFCSSLLRVPADFAADDVDLTVTDADLEYAGDPDGRFVPGVYVEGVSEVAPPSSFPARTPRFRGSLGATGTGAARVVLHADQGHAGVTTSPLPPATEMHVCAGYDPIEITAEGDVG